MSNLSNSYLWMPDIMRLSGLLNEEEKLKNQKEPEKSKKICKTNKESCKKSKISFSWAFN